MLLQQTQTYNPNDIYGLHFNLIGSNVTPSIISHQIWYLHLWSILKILQIVVKYSKYFIPSETTTIRISLNDSIKFCKV